MTEKGRNMKYDYLIVGAGLFGAVFAHEAYKKGNVLLSTRESILQVIFILKKLMILMFTNTEHIFFILLTRRYGSM